MINKQNSSSSKFQQSEAVPEKFTQSRVKNLYDFFLRRICQFIKQNHTSFPKQIENLLNIKKKKFGQSDFIELFHNRKISQEQQTILQEKAIEYLKYQATNDIQRSKQKQKTKDYSLQCIDQIIELVKDPKAFKYMKIEKIPGKNNLLHLKQKAQTIDQQEKDQQNQNLINKQLHFTRIEQQTLTDHFSYYQPIQPVPVPVIAYFSIQPQFVRYNTNMNDGYFYQNGFTMNEPQTFNNHYQQTNTFNPTQPQIFKKKLQPENGKGDHIFEKYNGN